MRQGTSHDYRHLSPRRATIWKHTSKNTVARAIWSVQGRDLDVSVYAPKLERDAISIRCTRETGGTASKTCGAPKSFSPRRLLSFQRWVCHGLLSVGDLIPDAIGAGFKLANLTLHNGLMHAFSSSLCRGGHSRMLHRP